MPPSTFAFGRRPPKDAPALPFAAVRAAAVPDHPSTYDSISGWTGWEMLYNDQFGVCVAVTKVTEQRIKSPDGQYPANVEEEVVRIYRTQNPGFDPATSEAGGPDDGGMNIQTLLELLVKTGEILCFAKVDHTDIEEMRAALAIQGERGVLWLGSNVTSDNQRQFPNTCWTPTGSVEGGHSTTGTGYDQDRIKHETWGHESCLTNDFVVDGSGSRAGLEEAWIAIYPSDAANLTEDQKAAFDAEYAAVTGGKHIAWPGVPQPGPFPEPTPPAPPVDPQAAFEAAAEEWLSHHHTSAVNVAFVKATEAYLGALKP